MLQSASSPPPSPLFSRAAAPQSPSRGRPLSFSGVANAVIKLRRGRHSGETKASYPLVSTSGEARTHSRLAEQGVTSPGKVPLSEEQRFLCKDGVDVKKLLRMIRAGLLEEAQSIGASVLVDEQWSCTIHSPRRDGAYKVDIRYFASAARSSISDPQQPIALDQARGIPGLMTVIG